MCSSNYREKNMDKKGSEATQKLDSVTGALRGSLLTNTACPGGADPAVEAAVQEILS